MNILQVISTLEPGGAERVFVDVCNLLNKSRINVTALFIRQNGILGTELSRNIPQYSLNRKFRYSILSMLRFCYFAKSFDIIHVHSRHNLLWVFVATKLYAFHSWKIVFHDHYGLIEIDDTTPRWFPFVGKRITHYIGVSSKLTKWAVEYIGLPKRCCSTLPNIRVLPNVESMSKKKNSSSNIIKLVHVANIHRIKNIEHSINLLKYLQCEYPVELTIYGQVADIDYSQELQRQIEQLGLEKKVHFISDETNIPSVLTSYDIGLCTSKFESGPLIVIEYMHSGLPFVSINRGEVIKQVYEYFPEFIIDSYDITEWIKAIKDILKKDTNMLNTSLKYRYQSLFNPDRYVNQLLDVYNKI